MAPYGPLWPIIDGETIVPVRSITQAAIPTPVAKTNNEAAIKTIINVLFMITSSSSMEMLTSVIAQPALKPFMRSATPLFPSCHFRAEKICCSIHIGSHIGGILKFHPLFG